MVHQLLNCWFSLRFRSRFMSGKHLEVTLDFKTSNQKGTAVNDQ
jgi:hypothetical protein